MRVKLIKILEVGVKKIIIATVAVAVIILMIAVDIYALQDMFIQSLANETDALVFGVLFAVITNGVPIIMGWSLATWLDGTTYKTNDRMNAKVGFWVGVIILFVVFILIFFVRANIIHSSGVLEFDEYGDYFFRSGWRRTVREELVRGEYIEIFGFHRQFAINLFLMFSPALTSLFSFIISWHIFRKDNVDKLEAEVDKLYDDFLSELKKYKEESAILADMKLELWSTLSMDKHMPDRMSDFKNECFQRVRSMLMDNGTLLYRRQLERFMAEIEGDIAVLINKLSEKSNIAHKITELRVADILTEMEKDEEDFAKKWNATLAFSVLQEEFKELLSNAIITEHTKIDFRQKTEEDPRS